MRVIYEEYDQTGRKGRYPFTDAATLVSAEGGQLPQGFVRSASLVTLRVHRRAALGYGGAYTHPDDAATRKTVWLSRVDFGNRTCVVSDTLGVVSEGTWDASGVCRLRAPGYPARRMGVIQVETGAAPSDGVLTFDSEATEFVPAVVSPVHRSGLWTLQGGDGEVVDEVVTLKGENGVFFTVMEEDSGHGFVNTFVGISALEGWDGAGLRADCDDREVVRTLRVSVADGLRAGDGSTDSVTVDGNTVFLHAALDCADGYKAIVMPGVSHDILCDPDPDPAEPADPDEPTTYDVYPVSSTIRLAPGINSAFGVEPGDRPHTLMITRHGRRHNTNGTV